MSTQVSVSGIAPEKHTLSCCTVHSGIEKCMNVTALLIWQLLKSRIPGNKSMIMRGSQGSIISANSICIHWDQSISCIYQQRDEGWFECKGLTKFILQKMWCLWFTFLQQCKVTKSNLPRSQHCQTKGIRREYNCYFLGRINFFVR